MKGHFSELLLFVALMVVLAFVIFMSHIHNDSLASKGMEFAGQVLAALLTLMVAAKPQQTNSTAVQFTDPKEK